MKNKLRKKLLIIISIVIVLLFATDIGVCNYLVNYAIGKNGSGGDRNVALNVGEESDSIKATITENEKDDEIRDNEFLSKNVAENVKIKSDDNLNLNGYYFKNDGSHKWVITLHGYRRDHKDNIVFARKFYEMGYQVLVPDLRACGNSEGNYIGMGWLDRKDVLKWVDWIINQDTQAQIIIHGVSMGAATTMMTSGENTKDNVKLFIEDCGYTSVWDVFSSELKLRFNMPDFPILYTMNYLAKIKAGYKFTDASAIKQVAKCQKPMLFIHGTKDNFIPYSMMDKLYQVKPGSNKTQLTIEDAGHAESVYANPDLYWNSIFSFVNEYVEN